MTDLRIPRLEPPNEPREKKFTSDNGDSFVRSKISAVGDFVDKVADWIGASPGGPDTTDDSESSVDFALGNGGGVTGSFSFDTDTDKGSLSLGGYAGVGGDMAISFDFGDGVFSGLANAKLESFSVGYGAVAGAKLGIDGMSVGLSAKVELGLNYDENGLYIGPQMQAGFHLLDLVVIQAEVVGGARVPYTQDIFPPVYDFGMAVPDAGILGGSGTGFGFEFGVPLNQGSGELASSEAVANKAAAKSGGNDRDRDPSSGGGAGITLSKTKPGESGGGNQDWKDAKSDTNLPRRGKKTRNRGRTENEVQSTKTDRYGAGIRPDVNHCVDPRLSFCRNLCHIWEQ